MKKLALALILCSPLMMYAKNQQNSIPDKAMICTACHGSNGISSQPEWPNLAGQHKTYFVKQLKEIKQGKLRKVPTMESILAIISEQDMDDLAAYYAKMPIAKGSTPKKFVRRGEQIYRGGDFDKKITACIACHGPKGTGNEQAGFPSLSGQHADYTVLQLILFKKNQRANDLNHIMSDISKRMSREDMEAVAHYIEGLH